MTPDQRVSDWLESGVVALSGFIPPGNAATCARRWAAELEVLTASLGAPVRVDGAQLLAERAALTGASGPASAVSFGGACRLLSCQDGWVAVSLPRLSDLELVAPLVEEPVKDPWAAVADWASRHAASDVVARARLLGLAVGRVGEGAPQLRLPPEVPEGPRARWASPPLVVDFSALWAGPLCASLLGSAGARVIKVETAARLDGARRGDAGFYDLLHAGQASVCFDPRLPADRTALQSLITQADVVIEASRPRALDAWGLSAGDAVRNGTVWLSITAYGRAQGDRVGFGDDVAAAAGLVGWPGGDGDGPVFVGDAIADPLAGIAAAVAALRALSHGTGQLVDIAMASVVAATLDGSATRPSARLDALPPTARPIPAPGPAAGADTARIRAELAA